MQAITLKKLLRHGALALALLAGAALLPQTASADSYQRRGDFGGTWSRIGPGDNYRRHAGRHWRAPIYAAPAYVYGPEYYYEPDYYGAPYDDYGPGIAYGPGIGWGGPGIGFSLGVD
jgi:hypothetical protein